MTDAVAAPRPPVCARPEVAAARRGRGIVPLFSHLLPWPPGSLAAERDHVAAAGVQLVAARQAPRAAYCPAALLLTQNPAGLC